MNEREALALAQQIDDEMGEIHDDYGWTFISQEDDGTWTVYFYDWPDEVHSPAGWEAMKERADW